MTRCKTVMTGVVAGLAMLTAVRAETTEPRVSRFLEVKGADKRLALRDHREFRRADLPPQAWSLAGNMGRKNPYDPVIPGYAVDLDGDGQPEYVLETGYGGLEGLDCVVLSGSGGAWREIFRFQGDFSAVPWEGRWPVLVTISRGSGGIFSKSRFQMSGRTGRYREVSAERCDENGIITKGSPAKAG